MGLRNVYLSAFIGLIAANLTFGDDSGVQPQSGSSRFNPFLPSGQFSPSPPGFNSFGFNPSGSNPFGTDPAAPRPPGFNSPGFDYSQFVPSGFRNTRDVSSLQSNNLKEPSESSSLVSSPSDSDPRLSPLSFISQFLPSAFGNSRQARDVSSQENGTKEDDPHQRLFPFGSNPLGSLPFGFNPFGSFPFGFNISQFLPFGSSDFRQTRDVSSQENSTEEDDPHQRLFPFGSNPLGSLPFGFNPFGSLFPFGSSDSRQTRDVSSQEGSTEEDPRQRLFFSLGSRLTTCNYTETPGISCANCYQALTCLPSNVGYVRRCTFFCNSGRCSFVGGSQCTNSTG